MRFRVAFALALCACKRPPPSAIDAAPVASASASTPAPSPSLWITGTTHPGGTSYPIDVPCGGDCTGKVTFTEGKGELGVIGSPGCKISLGGSSLVLDGSPNRLSVDVYDVVGAGRLPDVLSHEVVLDGTLACPTAAPRPIHVTFGAGAAVTEIWKRYEFAGANIPPFDPFRDGKPKNLVTAFDSDQLMLGPTLESDVVRYVGPPDDVANGVTYVGKVSELVQKRDTCGSVSVQRNGYAIDVYTYGKNTLVRKLRIPAPALDCATVGSLPLVHDESGDVRVARPPGTAIDAAVKSLVDR